MGHSDMIILIDRGNSHNKTRRENLGNGLYLQYVLIDVPINENSKTKLDEMLTDGL